MMLVGIGLGSNLDDPETQVRQALCELNRLPHSALRVHSQLYRTPPLVGPGVPDGQPDYCNAVALMDTALPPEALLDALQALEQQHGRQQCEVRWGPRPLDLDILFYGNEQWNNPRLQLPHPNLAQREFVLVPLAECDGDIELPGQGKVRELLVQCPSMGITLWPSTFLAST